jgi:hypothetical protein
MFVCLAREEANRRFLGVLNILQIICQLNFILNGLIFRLLRIRHIPSFLAELLQTDQILGI